MMEGMIAGKRQRVESTPAASSTLQGWIVISTTWLAVAAAAIVAPIAPQMAAHFADMPEAEGLTQLGIGLPALFVALLAAPMGYLADRIGRKPVLLTALIAYAIFGTAPLILNSLPEILLSRAGVGISEAAILAIGTALIGDMFQGQSREKWFAIQGGSATIAAVVLIALSGAIGETGWRAPFAVYFAPILIALLVKRFVPEPSRGARRAVDASEPISAGTVARVCIVTFFTAVAFYVVLIQLPFLFVDRGFTEPRLVASGVTAGAIAAPVGAYLFRRFTLWSVSGKMTLSFAFSSLGLTLIAVSPSYTLSLIGAAVNGIGSGMALPTLMTSAMAGVRLEQRGRIAGFWNASFFLGQFVSPLAFIGLVSVVGNRPTGFGIFAVGLAIAACAALGLALRAKR